MNSLDLLTGESAGELLAAAAAGWSERLVSWQVSQIDHRPTGVTTVAYQTRIWRADGEHDEILAARATSPGESFRAPPDLGHPGPIQPAAGPGMITVSDGEHEVRVWRMRHDPDLPALALATDTPVLTELLQSCGLNPADLQVRTLSYRPGRRAVLEITAVGGRVYLKVVPSSEVQALHQRHRILYTAGVPVPHSLGWSDQGLLVLEALPGVSLRKMLRNNNNRTVGGSAPGLPTAAEVIGLLDRIPAGIRDLPRRTPWSLNCGRYAAVIGAALPVERTRARQIAETVLTGLAGSDPGDEPTHGDFYEGQLTVSQGQIVGLLDVDTAGPGRRVDDLACAVAHLKALSVRDPRSSAAAARLGSQWRAAFRRTVDPAELSLRAAGVMIGLATGPHRVQVPGWEAATSRLLDCAEKELS